MLEPPFVVKPILKKIHITMIHTMIHTSSHSRPFSVSAAPRTSAQHKIAQDGNAKAFQRSLVSAPQVALISSSGIRHQQTASWSSTADVRPVVFSPCPRDPPWNDLAFPPAHTSRPLASPLHAHDTTLRRLARDAVVDVEQQHAKRRLVARAGRFLRYAVWRAP